MLHNGPFVCKHDKQYLFYLFFCGHDYHFDSVAPADSVVAKPASAELLVGRFGQGEEKSIRDLEIFGSGKRMWMGLGSVAVRNSGFGWVWM